MSTSFKFAQKAHQSGAVMTTVVLPKTKRMKPFANLLTEVIRPQICDACGACVATCPVSVIDMKEVSERDVDPTLVGRCILCQYCYFSCPRIELPEMDREINVKLFTGAPQNPHTEKVGYYLACYSARAKKPEILSRATDGGVVTALLAYALEAGVVRCVVGSTVSKEEPLKSVPKLAFNFKEVLEMSGTAFNIPPTLEALREAIEEYDMDSVALVGLPCHIVPARKMQVDDYGYLEFGEHVKLMIGLFCAGAFYYDGLVKGYMQKEKVIDIGAITKLNIKQARFLAYKGEEKILDSPLKEIKKYLRENCRSCPYGFSADLADISVGSNGSPEGWTTVIVRTEMGQKIFEGATHSGYLEFRPLEEVKPGLEEVVKLEDLKLKRLRSWEEKQKQKQAQQRPRQPQAAAVQAPQPRPPPTQKPTGSEGAPSPKYPQSQQKEPPS